MTYSMYLYTVGERIDAFNFIPPSEIIFLLVYFDKELIEIRVEGFLVLNDVFEFLGVIGDMTLAEYFDDSFISFNIRFLFFLFQFKHL